MNVFRDLGKQARRWLHQLGGGSTSWYPGAPIKTRPGASPANPWEAAKSAIPCCALGPNMLVAEQQGLQPW